MGKKVQDLTRSISVERLQTSKRIDRLTCLMDSVEATAKKLDKECATLLGEVSKHDVEMKKLVNSCDADMRCLYEKATDLEKQLAVSFDTLAKQDARLTGYVSTFDSFRLWMSDQIRSLFESTGNASTKLRELEKEAFRVVATFAEHEGEIKRVASSTDDRLSSIGSRVCDLEKSSLSREDFQKYCQSMAASLNVLATQMDLERLQKEDAQILFALKNVDHRLAIAEKQIGDFEKHKSPDPLATIKALCRPEIVKLFDMIRDVPEKWDYDERGARWVLDMAHLGDKFIGVNIIYTYSSDSIPVVAIKTHKSMVYSVRRLAERLLFSIYFPNKNDACNFDAVKALVEETTPAPEMTCDLNYFALKS